MASSLLFSSLAKIRKISAWALSVPSASSESGLTSRGGDLVAVCTECPPRLAFEVYWREARNAWKVGSGLHSEGILSSLLVDMEYGDCLFIAWRLQKP